MILLLWVILLHDVICTIVCCGFYTLFDPECMLIIILVTVIMLLG